jgi:hypothetical protein
MERIFFLLPNVSNVSISGTARTPRELLDVSLPDCTSDRIDATRSRRHLGYSMLELPSIHTINKATANTVSLNTVSSLTLDHGQS